MKNLKVNKILKSIMVITAAAIIFTGCTPGKDSQNTGQSIISAESDTNTHPVSETTNAGGNQKEIPASQLEVRFGDNGAPFIMHLESNDTAAAIAHYVGSTDWRLPIYERDNGTNYDVLQYYDIPDRYEIPSNPETVTSAKAGDVYYSDPNRIVLFYHDAEITEEYTRIGSFDPTDAFVTAVEENPVLEGWGNKIIQITQP